jgi:hypothetical protein
VLLLCALAAGCAAPTALIRPLPPSTLGRAVTVRQQITAHFHDHVRSLQVVLKVAPDDLTLIGLSPIGQRLFTLGWHGGQPSVKSQIKDLQHLPARRILADLELASWPLDALRTALTDPEMRLEELGDTRALWQGDRLLWIAFRGPGKSWHQKMTIYNARIGYRLDVQPLDNGS